jgi:molybdate transport system substrate-binding protein
VSKVTLGEADAGIVYITDIVAAGDKAAGVEIATADDPSLEALYPMAITANATDRELAHAWVTFVQSGEGQATLKEFGFLDL